MNALGITSSPTRRAEGSVTFLPAIVYFFLFIFFRCFEFHVLCGVLRFVGSFIVVYKGRVAASGERGSPCAEVRECVGTSLGPRVSGERGSPCAGGTRVTVRECDPSCLEARARLRACAPGAGS